MAAELRARAGTLLQAADLIDAAFGLESAPAAVAKGAKASTPRLGGTETAVLASIREGHQTIADVATAATLKPFTARHAMLSLEKRGRITRKGGGRWTRWSAA